MIVTIWYCRKCDRALKTDPPGIFAPRCHCQIPQLPKSENYSVLDDPGPSDDGGGQRIAA